MPNLENQTIVVTGPTGIVGAPSFNSSLRATGSSLSHGSPTSRSDLTSNDGASSATRSTWSRPT